MKLEDMKVGMRVCMTLPDGAKFSGRVGRSFEAGGIKLLIKFDNGGIGLLNERNAALFSPDLLN
jgi:hypothetical protein